MTKGEGTYYYKVYSLKKTGEGGQNESADWMSSRC